MVTFQNGPRGSWAPVHPGLDRGRSFRTDQFIFKIHLMSPHGQQSQTRIQLMGLFKNPSSEKEHPVAERHSDMIRRQGIKCFSNQKETCAGWGESPAGRGEAEALAPALRV